MNRPRKPGRHASFGVILLAVPWAFLLTCWLLGAYHNWAHPDPDRVPQDDVGFALVTGILFLVWVAYLVSRRG